MEQERDSPFLDSWMPQATQEFRHNIEESYQHAQKGFVWADLSHALSNPQSPVPNSRQPMMPFLADVFDRRRDEIMNRIVQMASGRPPTSAPGQGVHIGRSADPPLPSPSTAVTASIPVSHNTPMGWNHGGPSVSMDSRAVPSSNYTQANTHPSSTPPTYYSRNEAPGPAGQTPSPTSHYSQLTHMVAGPTPSVPCRHSHDSGAATAVTEAVREKECVPYLKVTRSAEEGAEVKGVNLISNDHDYSTHTQTQVERFLLSSAVSDDVAVTYLMRSEMHKRVLRTTIACCKSEDDFRGMYAKLMRGGRGQFVTFLRVQCHLFGALRELTL